MREMRVAETSNMPAACWLLKNSLKRAVKRNVLLVCDIWVVLIGGGLGGCWDF